MADSPDKSNEQQSVEQASARGFPPTSITLYQRIVGGSPERTQEALEEFFEQYWYPMYALMRSRGETHEDAADLVQGFIAEQLLKREQVRNWKPEEGRLRTFLKVALDRFRISEHRRATAQKRGGERARFGHRMDFTWAEDHYAGSLSDLNSPDKLYDRAWADSVVQQAITRVAEEYEERGRLEEFQLLSQHLSGRTGDAEAIGYRTIAEQLGTTPNNVKQKMSGYRQRLRSALIAVTKQTVGSGQVEDEVEYLSQILLGGR